MNGLQREDAYQLNRAVAHGLTTNMSHRIKDRLFRIQFTVET
jgi:hypothetical protein